MTPSPSSTGQQLPAVRGFNHPARQILALRVTRAIVRAPSRYFRPWSHHLQSPWPRHQSQDRQGQRQRLNRYTTMAVAAANPMSSVAHRFSWVIRMTASLVVTRGRDASMTGRALFRHATEMACALRALSRHDCLQRGLSWRDSAGLVVISYMIIQAMVPESVLLVDSIVNDPVPREETCGVPGAPEGLMLVR